MFKTESLLGKRFFYNDEEVGIGWESTIDTVSRNWLDAGYTLELSCGTIVKIDHRFLYSQRHDAYFTNLRK